MTPPTDPTAKDSAPNRLNRKRRRPQWIHLQKTVPLAKSVPIFVNFEALDLLVETS
jgi:hypothetical protein